MNGAGLCNVEEKGRKDVNALSMANVGGVFVVLGVGLLLSVVVAVIEFVWNERKHPLAADSSKVDYVSTSVNFYTSRRRFYFVNFIEFLY